MTTFQKQPKPRFVALLHASYIWTAPGFRLIMAEVGLKPAENACSGLPHKAIMASATSYWLDDYADEATLRDAFHCVLTYTVDDFVAEIKKWKENEE